MTSWTNHDHRSTDPHHHLCASPEAGPQAQGSGRRDRRAAIVASTKPKPGRSRQRPELESDPEAEASVRAFFKRMMPNHPLLQDD